MKAVYIDLLFGMNFLMDFVLLGLVVFIQKKNRKRRYLAAASALGAAWVCVLVIAEVVIYSSFTGLTTFAFAIIRECLNYLIIPLCMLRISGFKSRQELFRAIIVFFLAAFVIGGAINALYYQTGLGEYLKAWVWTEAAGTQTSGWLPVLITALAGAGCLILFIVLSRWHKEQSLIYECLLENNAKEVRLSGLYDTGNRLFEPITRKPVHIVEQEACRILFDSDESSKGLFFIPYRSVGSPKGYLYGCMIDSMTLYLREEKGRKVLWKKEHPLIGLCPHRLDEKGRYQMIIHSGEENQYGD